MTQDGKPATLGGGDPLEVARALQLVGEISVNDMDAEVILCVCPRARENDMGGGVQMV